MDNLSSELLNIATEIDSRDSSCNLLLPQYYRCSWDELCLRGRKYLNELTDYKTNTYKLAVRAEIMEDIKAIEKNDETKIDYTHLFTFAEVTEALTYWGWQPTDLSVALKVFRHSKKEYSLILSLDLDTFELILGRLDS